MENEYLAHHGVKGMKWGVRRTPEQLGHRVPTKRELKKKYRTDVRSANAAYRDARGKSVDRWERDEARNEKRANASYTDEEKDTLIRGERWKNLATDKNQGEIMNTIGAIGQAVHRGTNRDLYDKKEQVDAKRQAADDRAYERHKQRMAEARGERNAARAKATSDYKAAVASAKATDAKNYSDYKKAAASYKVHATRGERIAGALMGHTTAYYAQRQRGLTKGQAAADVFLTGNMGAMSAYNVGWTARRLLEN